MSFTVKIKEEISNIKSTKSEIIAELSGYIRNNGIFQDNKVTLNTENKFLVDRISNFIQVITDINPQVEIIENLNFSKKELYQITIENNLDKMLKELGIYTKEDLYNIENVIVKNLSYNKEELKNGKYYFCTVCGKEIKKKGNTNIPIYCDKCKKEKYLEKQIKYNKSR